MRRKRGVGLFLPSVSKRMGGWVGGWLAYLSDFRLVCHGATESGLAIRVLDFHLHRLPVYEEVEGTVFALREWVGS